MLTLKLQYLATWCEKPIHWKRHWSWERLRAEGEEGIRGWDGWMASPIQRTWNWANLRRWWGTERPGALPSMGSQRVVHDWATEPQLQHLYIQPLIHLPIHPLTHPSIQPSIHLSCTVKVYFLLNLHRIRRKHSFCFTCLWPLESPISLQIQTNVKFATWC